MAESASTASISSEFWHGNLVDIQSFTNAFIKKMAIENLSVKATLRRGYKFFHESYVHDIEGKLPAVICIVHHGAMIIIGAFFSNPNLESGQMKLNFFSFFTVTLAKEEEGITVRGTTSVSLTCKGYKRFIERLVTPECVLTSAALTRPSLPRRSFFTMANFQEL